MKTMTLIQEMTKFLNKKYIFNFFSFFSVWIILIPIIIVIFFLICLFKPFCCSKEEKENVRVVDLEVEDLHEVVTSAQGGTFELYVPKTPKLSQVFPFPYKWDGRAWVPASTAECMEIMHEVYSSKNPQLHQVVTSVEGGMFEFRLPKTPKLNQVYPFPYKWDGRAWVPASKADVQSFQNKRSIHPG